MLTAADLFKEGDKFTFEEYSHFLSKSNKAQETMDKGDVFPYEITIGKITDRTVTITVEKVK